MHVPKAARIGEERRIIEVVPDQQPAPTRPAPSPTPAPEPDKVPA